MPYRAAMLYYQPIGSAADSTDKARTLGMKNIIKQMQKLPVKR
ncbi:MAG: hypothetical protein R2765_07885 [Ferruginibacter sp.]